MMKFLVTMKDPDVLYDAIREAVDEDLQALDIDGDEHENLSQLRRDKIQTICTKWFRYGEYLTVEIDTEDETCLVIPND